MITIINFGMGNVASIANMLYKIGIKPLITSELADIENADKIILPGVGSFDAAVNELKKRNLFDLLNTKVLNDKIPVLGICLGMQLLCTSSEEGLDNGFGWVNAKCHKFKFGPDLKLKIPCMGWNFIKYNESNPLFKNLYNPKFYFVHSYHAVCQNRSTSIASAEYGYEYTVAIQNNNIFGVQFHPEKSHKFGMQLLKNFSKI